MHTLKLVCLSSLPAPVVMTLLPPVEAGAGGFAGLLADTAEADIVDVADADLVNLPDIVFFFPVYFTTSFLSNTPNQTVVLFVLDGVKPNTKKKNSCPAVSSRCPSRSPGWQSQCGCVCVCVLLVAEFVCVSVCVCVCVCVFVCAAIF
jgi:hypothetical protein